MEGAEKEDIESFLQRLKLTDKYLNCFLDNGYTTLRDCEGIDEQTLRNIGITLPGHYRRILNKLPGRSVQEPPKNSRMSLLHPGEVPDTARDELRSPTLQYLVQSSEPAAQAEIKGNPFISEQILSPDILEDPYLSPSGYNITIHDQTHELPDEQRPRTTPPPDFTEEFGDAGENPYECSLPPLPPPTPEDLQLNSAELPSLSLLPLPPPSEISCVNDIPEQGHNLREIPRSDAYDDCTPEEANLQRSSALPEDQKSFDSADSTEGIYDIPDPQVVRLQSPDVLEDEYDHIRGATTKSSASQSPNCLSTTVANIFTYLPQNIDATIVEDEYDRLNSKPMPSYHKKLSRQNSPSYLSPSDGTAHSRKTSDTNETILDSNGSDVVQSMSYPQHLSDDKSAKNMPLPLPPWKTAIDGKALQASQGDSRDPHAISTRQDSFSSTYDSGEMNHWAQDNTSFEGDYDTLSLHSGGQTNYNLKSLPAGNKFIADEEENADLYNYETVEYPDRRPKHVTLPPVPHNTPSRTLEDTPTNADDDIEDDACSYEEVVFLPKPAPRLETQDIAVYSEQPTSSDRNRSMTMISQNSIDKLGRGTATAYRRLTGMQAQLQKAAESAKAAMKHKPKKHKPKRKGFTKLNDRTAETTPHFGASNDSAESSSPHKDSVDFIDQSLEDFNDMAGLPPHYPHQRQPKDTEDRLADISVDHPGGSRLSRVSPVSRRKRGDAISYSNYQETNEDTYEDLRDEPPPTMKTDANIPPAIRNKSLKIRDNTSRRPMSVFVDSKFSMNGFEQARSRTTSATLKREPSAQSANSEDASQYVDIRDIISTKPPTVTAVSPMTKKRTKSGWLWKQGGHDGRAPLRKRWVVFDGDELTYYESDSKTEFSKGIIPVDVMLRVQIPNNDLLIFHVQTKGGRKYIFQAENGDERTMWTSTLMAAVMLFEQNDKCHQFKPGGSMYMPYKEGLLKMDGIRQKVYLAIKGEHVAYYKSKAEFQFAQPVARLQMKLATVKDVDKKKFQIVFPYRTFTLTADNEDEKSSWIEHLMEAVAEGLSDYQVLNEIWTNESNKKCADCGRTLPDWSSINLAIVICKHCAGVHRELGVHNSKVRSLKMDIKIWDPAMKRLLLDIGNDEANKFWASELNSSEAINDMADKNQRAWFIKAKYIDMSYVRTRSEAGNQDLLNQGLVQAVRGDNLLEAYHLTFSGADLNCNTGKEHAKTPQLLAEYLTYNTLAEFLRQNGATDVTSPEGHITERYTSVRKKDSFTGTRAKPPVSLRDCLFKYGGDFKGTAEDKAKGKFNLIISAFQPGDFQKRLCVLENNILKYCDPEKPSIIKDYISCNDLISVTVYTPEQAVKAGYKHCFELSRTSGRTYLFCAIREDTLRQWTRGLLQAIVPAFIQDVMQCEQEYDRVGKIKIKAIRYSKSNTEWSTTWCRLRKKKFQYFHNESSTMDTIDLRKLVQIAVDQTQEMPSNQTNGIQSRESIPVIMLVFRDKSYHVHSDTKQDTESWMAALQRSDNVSGPTLEEKQLTGDGVPIVLEKCITFVEQCGITMRGIYRLSGTHSKTTQLLKDFRRNARETQMREGDLNVHDVANALKRWFKSLPGSLLTEHLHEQWIETAQIREEHHNTKLEWYKHLIEKLPEINRITLKIILQHLKNVSNHEQENEMSIHNIAIVFGPTLMEPMDDDSGGRYIGQTSHEICCIEDLLRFYDWLFDVTETDRKKDEMMQLAKAKIDIAKKQQNMLTTLDYDMMVPIYINCKEDKCVNYKVNLYAEELVNQICKTHGYPSEKWGLYEVILGGDAERPLHYKEHVLSVIKSWTMPSTNYLVAKNDFVRDKMRWFKQAIPSGMDTIMEGNIRIFEGKKKWAKATGSITGCTNGSPHFKYVKASSKTAVSFDIKSIKVYIGVDRKTKPPGSGKQGFTIMRTGEPAKYFVAETEGELYRWISHILLCMHPEGFTPPVSTEVTPVKSSSPDSLQRHASDASGKMNVYGTVSQQELGAAVAKVATQLRRSSSNESTGSARLRFHEEGREGSTNPGLQQPTQAVNDLKPSSAIPSNHPMYSREDGVMLEDVYDLHRPRHSSTGAGDIPLRPNAQTTDGQVRRPVSHYAQLSVDPRNQRAGLGIQLRDELSNVLRKRTQ